MMEDINQKIQKVENKIDQVDDQLKEAGTMLRKRARDWTEDDKNTFGNHESLRKRLTGLEEKEKDFRDRLKRLEEEKKDLREEKNRATPGLTMEALVDQWIAKQQAREQQDGNISSRRIISPSLVSASEGRSFDFSDRIESMAVLANCLSKRYDHWSNGRGDRIGHPLPFLAYGPGSGKSRFLCELPFAFRSFVFSDDSNYSVEFKETMEQAIYINITFGNGTPYSSKVESDVEWALCSRILCQLHGTLGLPDIEKSFANQSLILVLLLKELKKFATCVVLGIDEVNKLYDAGKDGKENLQTLFNVIGGASCLLPEQYPFFVPVVAGTVIGPIKEYINKSTHPPLNIPLPLLSVESCLRIASTWDMRGIILDRSTRQFRQFIAGVDGHCRALEHLYIGLLSCNPSLSSYLDHAFLFAQSQIHSTYLASFVPLQDHIAYSFLPVGADQFPSRPGSPQSESQITLLDLLVLEERGVLKLENNRIRIPYIFICTFILRYAEGNAFGHWKQVLMNHQFQWQTWEEFNQVYIAFRLSMFSFVKRTRVPLSTFFADCQRGSFTLGNIDLIIPPINVIQTHKIDYRYPSTEKPDFETGISVLNGQGAPFDAFIYLETTQNSRVLIALQMKWAQVGAKKPMVLTQDILEKEHAKIRDSIEKHLPGTPFISFLAGRCKQEPGLTIPKDCIVLTDETMSAFYGPYHYQRLKIEDQ